MHRLIQIDDTIGMYDEFVFGKELKFYRNHKSEIGKNMLLLRLQTIPRIN
jgi:hypothetical protein